MKTKCYMITLHSGNITVERCQDLYIHLYCRFVTKEKNKRSGERDGFFH